MAVTGGEPGDLPADPDDINSRLAEIAAELTAQARFTEPRAADRARIPVGPVRPVARTGPLQRLRNRRLVVTLGTPGESARRQSIPGSRQSRRPRAARPSLGRALARRAYRRRLGRTEPVPDRGYATSSYRSPHQSLAVLLAAIVILIALSFLVVSFIGRP